MGGFYMQYLEGTWSQDPIFFPGTLSNWVPNLYMPQLQCLYWALMSPVSIPDGCRGFPGDTPMGFHNAWAFPLLTLAVYHRYTCSTSVMVACPLSHKKRV